MSFFDFDHNGVVDGRDYYLFNELLNSNDEENEDESEDKED